MILRYTLAWFLLLIAAILNGAARESFYKSSMSELSAHQLSTLTGIFLFGIIIRGLSKVWKLKSDAQAWTVGFIWLALTLAFEFLFFHYVGGKPWDALLHNYNILEGRTWPLILIWVTIAPYIFYRLGQTRDEDTGHRLW